MLKSESAKPLASLSLDLDDQWSYLKTLGRADWQSSPSFLPVLVPRILAFLARHNLRITIFVVGLDAAQPRSEPLLRQIVAAGHEIGNHSFHHEPWLHLYSEEQLRSEVVLAEEAIEAATGVRPFGFRGPGFCTTRALRRILAGRGYRYDASRCANLLSPLASLYYYRNVRLTGEQRRERSRLNGGWTAVFGPNRARLRKVDSGDLVEVPVTTTPLLRLPLHVSYLQALGVRFPGTALAYFRWAMSACRLTGNSPSILLHPTDFLGCDDHCDLPFFPAMGLPAERKMALVRQVVQVLAERFRIVPVGDHAGGVRRKPTEEAEP